MDGHARDSSNGNTITIRGFKCASMFYVKPEHRNWFSEAGIVERGPTLFPIRFSFFSLQDVAHLNQKVASQNPTNTLECWTVGRSCSAVRMERLKVGQLLEQRKRHLRYVWGRTPHEVYCVKLKTKFM